MKEEKHNWTEGQIKEHFHSIKNIELTILALTTMVGFLKHEPHGSPHSVMTIDSLTEAAKYQYGMYIIACTYWKQEVKSYDDLMTSFEITMPENNN